MNSNIACIIIYLFSSSPAQAQLFKIINRDYGSASGNATVVAEIDAAFDALENQINTNLPQVDSSEYLSGVANSTTQALSIIGGDPAAAVDIFSLKAHGALGADLGGNTPNDLLSGDTDVNQIKGANLVVGLEGGLSLNKVTSGKWRFIDFSKMKLFFGFASSKRNIDSFDFNYQEFHILTQYKIIPEKEIGLGLFKWNGIDLISGIKKSTIEFEFSQSLTGQSTQSLSGGGSLQVDYSSLTRLGVESDTLLVPIDAYTGVHAFIFDFFTGVGIDLVQGSAKAIANTTGPVSASESPSNFGSITATAVMDLGDTGSAQALNSRWTIGTGLNFSIFSIQGIYSKSLSNGTQAIGMNAQIFY